MLIIRLALLLIFTSCAMFRTAPVLTDKDLSGLLSSVKITGEGKGRLTLGQNQYVFGVDSVLKDHDWILAVSIPLHGEEVMILRNLRQKVLQDEETESFEKRIQWEFKQRNLDKVVSAEKFLQELRLIIRFILSSELGLKRQCNAQEEDLICELEKEKFIIARTEKKFFIRKHIAEGQVIELVAQNLTDSFFSKNDFHLYTKKEEMSKNTPSFSLELFW